MWFKRHVSGELSAYCRRELGPAEARRVESHLQSCARCRRECEEIRLGVRLAEQLPLVSAPEAMWSQIEALLEPDQEPAASRKASPPRGVYRPTGSYWWWWRPRDVMIAASLLLTLTLTLFWLYSRPTPSPRASWEVDRLEGAPQVGAKRFAETARLAEGEWLETNDSSRAKINVGEIGEVEVAPNSRVRLVEASRAEHRLALERGRLRATIWAPPRLFFVETPSAVAVDYGCAYTLEVDGRGASTLEVTAGWVALELGGRASMVPAGAACQTRPGTGPGTPYFADAPPAFRDALMRFDFENGGDAALDTLLAAARPADTLSLWHLLSRADGARRARVYDRMAELVPPPRGVTREGIEERLDPHMLELWRDETQTVWFTEEGRQKAPR